MPPLARRLLLTAVSVALALLLADVVCRALPTSTGATANELPWLEPGFYRLVDDPRGYEIVPRANSQIGRLGLRGPDIAAEKPPRAYRVLVLGDSIAYGIGVPMPEGFTRALERGLRARRLGRPVQVLNAGVPGYNSRQALARPSRPVLSHIA